MEAGRRRSGRPSHPTFRKPSRCASQPTAARNCWNQQIRQKPTVLASEYYYVCLASINTSSPSPAAPIHKGQSSQSRPPNCFGSQIRWDRIGQLGWRHKAADISSPIPTVAHPLLGRSLLRGNASLGSASIAPRFAYQRTDYYSPATMGRIAPRTMNRSRVSTSRDPPGS